MRIEAPFLDPDWWSLEPHERQASLKVWRYSREEQRSGLTSGLIQFAAIVIAVDQKDARKGHCCFSGCNLCSICGACLNSMHGFHHMRYDGSIPKGFSPTVITFERPVTTT